MQANNICALATESRTMVWFGTSKMHLSPLVGLNCCPFTGGGSVVVDSLFIDTPIFLWGFCIWSLFCYSVLYALLVLKSS